MDMEIRHFIDGQWVDGTGDGKTEVYDPATGDLVGYVHQASRKDLDHAVDAAERGFKVWKATSAFERYKVVRKAADLLRARRDAIAEIMTREQGKPIKEAQIEIDLSADLLDWFAEEGRRGYGRAIPPRGRGVTQIAMREPVGPVAAFTPWNFPISQAIRKIGPALAVGCSMIIKPPQETPASPAALADVFRDAGLPAGVLNFVYGNPAVISEYLIPHPSIRKVSFTGSVQVGKKLAALAGEHMKRSTMELGGHAPVMIFEDADIETASRLLAFSKYRNAGQVCVSPTRFLIQERVYEKFIEQFSEHVKAIKVGPGSELDTMMGPVINARRLGAVEELITDATGKGARLRLGGERLGNKGYFLSPTILTDMDTGMSAMNDEPFGPVALMMPFETFEDAIAEANRLPFGLASYAFTSSGKTATDLAEAIEVGMLTINHLGLAMPETPFGGVRDSGYGSEGGIEALESYYNTKFVTHLNI
jgi:succinate-semialdehyde dehydrogenase/glutarate-semialdehyde dehydrogenase